MFSRTMCKTIGWERLISQAKTNECTCRVSSACRCAGNRCFCVANSGCELFYGLKGPLQVLFSRRAPLANEHQPLTASYALTMRVHAHRLCIRANSRGHAPRSLASTRKFHEISVSRSDDRRIIFFGYLLQSIWSILISGFLLFEESAKKSLQRYVPLFSYNLLIAIVNLKASTLRTIIIFYLSIQLISR